VDQIDRNNSPAAVKLQKRVTMSNPIAHAAEVVGHDIKIAAVDTEHAIVKTVEFLPKAEKLIASAIKDQPEVKSAVLDLVTQATAVIGDVTIDVADKGINLAADAKTLADAEAFFTYFKNTFIPLVESIYSEVKTDVQ
jgi:hypothetical protein